MKLVKKPSKKAVLVCLMLASVVMAVWGAPVAEWLRIRVHWLLSLGRPGMSLTAWVKSGVGGGDDLTPAEAGKLKDENESLRWRAELAEQKLADYLRQEKLKEEVGRSLFGRDVDFSAELIPAQVAASDSLPYGGTRLLNKGAAGGAETGARVVTLLTDRSKALPPKLATITSSALVGRLMETGAHFARLQLVTDAGFKLRARIYRDTANARTISVLDNGAAAQEPLSPANNRLIEVEAQGDGADGMIVREVKRFHNVLPGDWLITSKDDAFLPEHVRVGRVTAVEDDPRNQLFVTVRVRPHADLSSLREVFIVVPLGARPDDDAAGTRK